MMTAVTYLDERRQTLLFHRMSENNDDVQVISLDENFHNSPDYLRVQSTLVELNSTAQFFSDLEVCVDCIQSIKYKKIIVIVSNKLARRLLAQISTCETIVAIFIFSINHPTDQSLINEDERVINICTDEDRLLESIRNTIIRIEQQTLAFCLFDQKQSCGRNLGKESVSFLWNQMLIYLLKQLPQDEQTKDDMLKICCDYYRNNETQLKKIKDFRLTYTSDKAIEWYTADTFLYKLLNTALRTENIELLYAFRFFIIDLCAALEKESQRSKDESPSALYRGTRIPKEELQKLQQNEGKIISMNGFLSTSRNLNVSLAFAGQSSPLDDFPSVLFEIKADLSLKTVVFADIQNRAQMKHEEEVLFGLNTVFKIGSAVFDSTLKVWKVELTTTDKGSEKVQEYLVSVKERSNEYKPLIFFGRILLFNLGQIEQAKKYFYMLLKSMAPCELDTASIYNCIGHVHRQRHELQLALQYYKLAYQIRRKILPLNNLDVAASIYNIAGIYRRQGDSDRALNYYRQVLTIVNENYPDDHEHIAVTRKNIGRLHIDKGEMDKARRYLFQALDIFKRVLQSDHSQIVRCLGYIGYAYEKKGELDRALDYYHQQMDAEERCWPPDHPDRFANLSGIVSIYMKMNKVEKARHLCREKLNAQKSILGEQHSCIARILIITAYVLENEDYNEALQHYEKAMSILEHITLLDRQEIILWTQQSASFVHSLTALEDLQAKHSIISSFSPDTLPMMDKVFELFSSMKRTTSASTAMDGPDYYDYHMLLGHANCGSITARKMYDALEHFAEALYIFTQNDTLTEDEENRIMHHLSQCYRIEHIVAQYRSLEIRNKLKDFVDRVLRRCNTTVSKLDEDTRICYTSLHLDSHTMLVNFLSSCKQKYPKSINFFETSVSMNGFLGQHEATLYDANCGLEIDPNNYELLYDKAGALRLLGKDMDEAIEAYRVFLAVAPKDHRKVPDSYYAMATCYLMNRKGQSLENVTKMYQKGEEAEKLQLPCFLPYDPSIKTPTKHLLDLMSLIKTKPSTLHIDNKARLKDPARIEVIVEHRQSQNTLLQKKNEAYLASGSSTYEALFSQRTAKSLVGLKSITFKEMDLSNDHVYERYVLCVTIIGEAYSWSSSIQLMTEDEHRDYKKICIYGFPKEQGEYLIKKIFRIGSKMNIINPYLGIGASDKEPVIRIDEFSSIVMQSESEYVVNMCRCCGEANAQNACSNCKRALYCTKECQTMDWQLYKHKLICVYR